MVDLGIVSMARFLHPYSMVNDMESLLTIIKTMILYIKMIYFYVFVSEYIYIYTFHSRLPSLFIDHGNNNLITRNTD